MERLHSCHGTKNDLVTIEQTAKGVTAQWNDGGIPQLQRFAVAQPNVMPPMPDELRTNNTSLLSAMRHACECSDSTSTRFALNCIQLRGTDGRITGTDGKQLLMQSGFDLGWDDAPLIPASRVWSRSDLAGHETVEIGRTEKWVTVRTGPWTIHLPIDEGRFPELDHHVPSTTGLTPTLLLTESDAVFLQGALKRLPVIDDHTEPITLELNGQAAIRARAADNGGITKLVLSRSTCSGDTIRLNMNRQFLARAARLGFRELYFPSPEAPAFSRDQHRQYIWALLDGEGAIKSSESALRIDSADASVVVSTPRRGPNTNPNKRSNISPMTEHMAQTNGNGRSRTTKSIEPEHSRATTVLDEAQQLRDTLKLALGQTRQLISSLRKRKKQSKLVESTLASLRQLNTIDK